jgi:hypothetical protein
MSQIVEKYYPELFKSILEYGVSFNESSVIDTLVGTPFYKSLLSANNPQENYNIILEVFSKTFNKKIKTLLELKRFELDKSNGLQLIVDDKKIIVITQMMSKDKIFQNHDYDFYGEPLLMINQKGVTNLSRMKYVDFDLWIGANLEKFGGLETVKGKVMMARNTIKNIDTLKEVNEINIYDGNIDSLGSIERINGNCRLGSNLKSLGELKYVGGDILIQSKDIYSLGNLEYVGKRLRIRKTNIIDLGNLKTVNGEILIDRKAPEPLVYQLNKRGLNFKKG